MKIERVEAGRGKICEEILRSLPLWFGIEAAIKNYVADVETRPCFVAFADGARAIGLLALTMHSEATGEIHVMAVRPEFHRSGVGKALLAAAEDFLRASGREFITVKTISAASANKEYALTRKFYLGAGFKVVEEFPELWGKENPCWLLIKHLTFSGPGP